MSVRWQPGNGQGEGETQASRSAPTRHFPFTVYHFAPIALLTAAFVSQAPFRAEADPSSSPQANLPIGEPVQPVVPAPGCSAWSLEPRRLRGPAPPPEGVDALPGIDYNHLRQTPQALPIITPGELVPIPAGPFQRGSAESPDEGPVETIDLPAFSIERTEVSVGQFKRFVAEGGYDDERHWSTLGAAWKRHYLVRPVTQTLPDAWPVVMVSFYEAEAYAHWAGRRLPTEAEWEKAARGTDGRRWPWGNTRDPTRSNHWAYKIPPATPPNLSWPVASWLEGRSPYGVLQLAGNVSEWTISPYTSNGYRWRLGQKTPWLTARGGDWTGLLYAQRTTAREPVHPGERRPTLGFRCAADPTPSSGRD